MSKPKTIADLKINWDFNFETYLGYDAFRRDFRNRNHDLKIYNIVNNPYLFNIVINGIQLKDNIVVYTTNFQLIELMFEIDYQIACRLFTKPENYCYELEKFVKTNEKTFDILLTKKNKQ